MTLPLDYARCQGTSHQLCTYCKRHEPGLNTRQIYISPPINLETGKCDSFIEPSVSKRKGRTEETPLTSRELQVIELVSRGYENVEIAKALGLSKDTIASCMKRIFFALGASNRTEAAVIAVRKGLI